MMTCLLALHWATYEKGGRHNNTALSVIAHPDYLSLSVLLFFFFFTTTRDSLSQNEIFSFVEPDREERDGGRTHARDGPYQKNRLARTAARCGIRVQ